ncbi:uncharacterized protein isoform X2 [Leptinotarsa decemlineata]|uniref:uncharacterized protein isoform X2 n=1 Tax=Leptinotarsa decemlineata TaxID=7539 RepID=UPI003D30633D
MNHKVQIFVIAICCIFFILVTLPIGTYSTECCDNNKLKCVAVNCTKDEVERTVPELCICCPRCFKEMKGFVCPEDYCHTVKCAPAHCNETQIFVEKGGTCGCCDACYTKLYENDRCRPLTIGTPFMAKCVDGLVCDKDGTYMREKNMSLSFLMKYF